ncbi:LytR family transcriptional regulator [Subtercola sp. Z020]|uniref:LCP family protein n=1 Tax=Subtercola sp. Z020 TaxID=2080582 RepID=UPI000CE9148A|nr:LCP family protein [Subtercola sp. Z020]PPF75448.1 LytR family transcriptional regulator [Subtercola sp. Z020]
MSARDLQVKHGRAHARRPIGVLVTLLVAVVAVLAVSSTSVAAIAVAQTFGRLKPGIQLQTADGGQAAPVSVGAIEGGVNLLLVGTDTRTDQGSGFEDAANQDASSGLGNNDVTILLHISADHSNAAVISFPRDMMGPVPECPDPNGDGGTVDATDFAMFNTTLSRGGLSCTVLTVEAITGLKIPYAAEISFAGVSAMSTAVGGVTVCLASPVVDPYTGLDLEAGPQDLVGDEALAFVRTRHGVADGSDLGRISNQQVFLSALMRKVTSAGVLANPVTLYQLANAAGSNMSLSTSLTNPNSMVSIALALKDVNLSNLVFVQYPVVDDPDDANRVVPDDSAAAILNAALVNDQPLTITGGTGQAAEADPNATPAETAGPSDAGTPPADGTTPTDTPTDAPAATPSTVALPSTVTGQTAAEETCTVGN